MPEFKMQNLYLKDARIEMATALRFVLRLITYSFYTLFTAAVLSLLLTDIPSLFWLGVLGALFLADRMLHVGEAERTLNDPGASTDETINIANHLAPKTLSILERAIERSSITGSNLHLSLLKILIKEKDVAEALARLEISSKEFETKIDDLLKSELTQKIFREKLFDDVAALTKIAFVLGQASKEKFIEPRVLFAAAPLAQDAKLNRLFGVFGIDSQDLQNAMLFGRFSRDSGWLKNLPASLAGFANSPSRIRKRFMNRAWTARPTPTLDKYSIDFTNLARREKIGFLIGHKEEYNRLIDILSRPSKPNALLVGDPGSGKETIIAHLAFKIAKDEVPAALFDKRLISLQIGNLVSGATSDEVSKRVNDVIGEILAAGNVILHIPDIHNLTKTSGPQYLSAADILIPAVTTDEFPLVGSTYPREFKAMIESQSDFSSAFEIIRVNEISEEEATQILTYESLVLEKQYHLTITIGAVNQAVNLAHKYFRQKFLPSSAEELLKEALAWASQKGDRILRSDDLIQIAERKINIPLHRTNKEETEKLLNLESLIHERLVDQEEAVKAVSSALREYRSGLARQGGPMAAFLFVGPTGVGKTELAKTLAKIQFGSEKMMIRFDMSEYQDKQSIYRFIGSPDGRMAGNLTESVIQKPYSLILLDEFEKANSDILNLFLQVFDDGRLTDNLGRTIDFVNTMIIATSNAHSEFIKTHIEAHTPMPVIAEELKKKLTDYFRPELLNRFSNIIVFKTLSREDIEAIARIQLKNLAQDVLETNAINLFYDDAVVKKVAELGFDPVFGARPLRGVISDKIRSVLAEKILKGEIVKGSEIKISLEADELKFSF
ncbi:ATP-dependent Clp protease ATP-binding subunit [Candidatus Wolfebacteria bacterium]|nr:ATP-dependent Clp protease ATP-binding subunit [Candidatus Wolfebacteria bacterium]